MEQRGGTRESLIGLGSKAQCSSMGVDSLRTCAGQMQKDFFFSLSGAGRELGEGILEQRDSYPFCAS